MLQSETDEKVVDLYNDGEEEALKILIERYTPVIYNFTVRSAGRDSAKDITQEVFIKAWKGLGKFDSSKASFKTWIFTITKNSIVDFLRKKKSILFSDIEKEDESFSESIPDETLLPDETLQKLQDSNLLNSILEKLSLEYRTVLLLHYQEEMTFEEISKILNKPINTVKSQHRRAIIKIRELLASAPK